MFYLVGAVVVFFVGLVLYTLRFKHDNELDIEIVEIKPFNPIRLSPSTNNLRSCKKQS